MYLWVHVHAVQHCDGEQKHTTHMHIISKMETLVTLFCWYFGNLFCNNLQDYLKPDHMQSDLGCVHTKTKNQGGHVAVVQRGGSHEINITGPTASRWVEWLAALRLCHITETRDWQTQRDAYSTAGGSQWKWIGSMVLPSQTCRFD